MNKVKDQQEGIENAKLFSEAVKLAWSYDLYDSDNGWGMGLGAKTKKDGDVCTLAEILKKDDEESEEKEEEEQEEDDDEIEAADELMKTFNKFFTK